MSKEIVAKFEGHCQKCRGRIAPGTRIIWDGSRNSRHVECPEKPTDANLEEAPVRWSESSQGRPVQDGMVGVTVRAPRRAGEAHAGQLVTVVRQGMRYFKEDGLSFGLDADRGWLVTYYARPATEQETSAFEANEVAERAAYEEADRRKKERAEREQRAIAEAQAQRDAAVAGLVSGGELGFTFSVVDGDLATLVSWEVGRDTFHVARGVLKNGALVVRQLSYFFDDDRETFWSTTEGVELMYVTFLAEVNGRGGRFTPEYARDWLSKYAHCSGKEFFTWLAGREAAAA